MRIQWAAFVDEVNGGAVKYVHQDRQGSVFALSDSGGNIQSTDKFVYDPYGLSPSSSAGFPFRYTGQRLDPETGLYYYRARYYNSTLARFMQTDPIGIEGGLDLYAYVSGDPLDAKDPSGTTIVVIGDDEFQDEVESAFDQLRQAPFGRQGLNEMTRDKHTFILSPPPPGGHNRTIALDPVAAHGAGGSGSIVQWDPKDKFGGVNDKGSNERPPYVGLAHELLGHADENRRGHAASGPTTAAKYSTPPGERHAIEVENMRSRRSDTG